MKMENINELSMMNMKKIIPFTMPSWSSSTIISMYVIMSITKMILTNHPPSKLCLMMLFLSIQISYMAEILYPKSILPFIIMLTISGGMLVVFMYFTSLSNNEKEEKSKELLPLTISWTIAMSFWIYSFFTSPSKGKMILKANKSNIHMDNYMMLNKMFSKSMWFLTILTTMLLVIILLCAIKMVSKTKAPMRRSTKI